MTQFPEWFKNGVRRVMPYRWRELVWQLRHQQPTEDDIYLFQHISHRTQPPQSQAPGTTAVSQPPQQRPLVLDIGANRGQFALSVFSVNPDLHVFSLEANPELRWILMAVKLLHPLRYRFRMVGAGSRAETLTIHIPESEGTDLSPNASLCPEEFDKEYVDQRLRQNAHRTAGQFSFRQRQARIIPVDSLGLTPIAIKIDVEGFELQVLQGLEKTLTQHYPLLMIEMNNQHVFMPWLAQRGYRFYRYDKTSAQLLPLSEHEWTLNVIALHHQTPAMCTQALLKP